MTCLWASMVASSSSGDAAGTSMRSPAVEKDSVRIQARKMLKILGQYSGRKIVVSDPAAAQAEWKNSNFEQIKSLLMLNSVFSCPTMSLTFSTKAEFNLLVVRESSTHDRGVLILTLTSSTSLLVAVKQGSGWRRRSPL